MSLGGTPQSGYKISPSLPQARCVNKFLCAGTLLGLTLGVTRSLFNGQMGRDVLVATATGHDVLSHVISALHLCGRSVSPTELMEARLRAICRKAPAVAKLLRGPLEELM